MAEKTAEALTGAQESALHVCEICDQPSRHLIQMIGMDNRPHYVCWSCRNREEKRINHSPTWKRTGRQR
jgi:hypothetical protein